MPAQAAPKTPTTTQDEPTRPQPMSDDGHTLDAHGLPLAGPARIAALDGKPDPALATPVLHLDTPLQD